MPNHYYNHYGQPTQITPGITPNPNQNMGNPNLQPDIGAQSSLDMNAIQNNVLSGMQAENKAVPLTQGHFNSSLTGDEASKTVGPEKGLWDKMKGNPSAMWAAGNALTGLLQHLGRAKEQKRKDKIAAVAARWSPVTGDNSWQQQAYANKPNLLNSLTQGALSGYQFGEGLRKGNEQEAQAKQDREAQQRLFEIDPEFRKQYLLARAQGQ